MTVPRGSLFGPSLTDVTQAQAVEHLREASCDVRLALRKARAAGIRAAWLEREGNELEQRLLALMERLRLSDEH